MYLVDPKDMAQIVMMVKDNIILRSVGRELLDLYIAVGAKRLGQKIMLNGEEWTPPS